MININPFDIIIGVVSLGTLLLIIIMAVYGKIIKLQLKIWIMTKRGYLLVEHVLPQVRNYYFLRSKDGKFEFRDSFFIDLPGRVTRIKSLVHNVGFRRIKSDEELVELRERMSNKVIDDRKINFRWGVPMITFVGDSPFPENFYKKEDDSDNPRPISELYRRLINTTRFNYIKRIITFCIIIIVISLIVAIALYFIYNQSNNMASHCLMLWNSSQERLLGCMNNTGTVLV